MPTFKRSQPLTPEGFYTGIIKGAGQETTKEGVVRLKLPIHTADGKIIHATVPFGDADGRPYGFVQRLVQSVGLQLPDDPEADPLITPDDVDRLQVWYQVKHKPSKDGLRIFANVNFCERSTAIANNPALAQITFREARKPGKLRAAVILEEEGEAENGPGNESENGFENRSENGFDPEFDGPAIGPKTSPPNINPKINLEPGAGSGTAATALEEVEQLEKLLEAAREKAGHPF